MAQDYTELQGSTIVASAPSIINKNNKSIMSNFSAATPPTTNLVAGMAWYNSDEKQMYHLAEDLTTWVADVPANASKASTADNATHASTADNATNASVAAEATDVQTSAILTILDALYPVGTIYTTVEAGTPFSKFNFGTWEQLPAGRVLVAQGDYVENGETFSFTAGSTGGEAKHQLTVGEMPAHYHTDLHWGNPSAPQFGVNGGNTNTSMTAAEWNIPYNVVLPADNAFFTGYTGGSSYHNNIQPYISVYLWKRTA